MNSGNDSSSNSRASSQTHDHRWRVTDVFLVLVSYSFFLLVFLIIEARWLGAVDVVENRPWIHLFEELVDAAILSLLPILIVVKRYRVPLEEIGFSTSNIAKNICIGFATGVALWLVMSGIDLGITKLVGPSTSHPYLEMLDKAVSPSSRIAVLLSIVVLAPISEEIFFRGFVFTIFKRNYGRVAALIASATLFSIVHFDLLSFVQIFVAGFGLAILFDWTRSLVSPMLAHVTLNVFSVYFR